MHFGFPMSPAKQSWWHAYNGQLRGGSGHLSCSWPLSCFPMFGESSTSWGSVSHPLLEAESAEYSLCQHPLHWSNGPRATTVDLGSVPSPVDRQGQHRSHFSTWQWQWQLHLVWGTLLAALTPELAGAVASARAPFFGVFRVFVPALLCLILVLWPSGSC